MIAGTEYSPEKAFIAFARQFFEQMAEGNYGAALSGLDFVDRRWSKAELVATFSAALGDQTICSTNGFTKSASPSVSELTSGHFVLRHKVPADSKWSSAVAIFHFIRKPGTGYYHVRFLGVEP